MRLASAPFESIILGKKTIESRLYDEKRQKVGISDNIIFINRDDVSQRISAKVVGLLRYETFSDLFTHNDIAKFGGESIKQLEKQINQFYSLDDQRRNGVLGIEFELT